MAPCFPGAVMDTCDGDSFTGTVKVKLGPISMTYKGKGAYTVRDAAAHRGDQHDDHRATGTVRPGCHRRRRRQDHRAVRGVCRGQARAAVQALSPTGRSLAVGVAAGASSNGRRGVRQRSHRHRHRAGPVVHTVVGRSQHTEAGRSAGGTDAQRDRRDRPAGHRGRPGPEAPGPGPRRRRAGAAGGFPPPPLPLSAPPLSRAVRVGPAFTGRGRGSRWWLRRSRPEIMVRLDHAPICPDPKLAV
ncbi:MAG: hypothetical protein ACRDRK_11375 [Pseudonocardia sp.]